MPAYFLDWRVMMKNKMVKRLLTGALVGVISLGNLTACGNQSETASEMQEAEALATEETEESEDAVEDGVMTLYADGKTGITDSSYDYLFEGTAADGVKELIDEGKVTINGENLPSKNEDGTYSAEEMYTNDRKTFWLNEDGTWSYNAHILFSGENEEFDQAIVDFVNANTMLSGINYEVTIENGIATAIDITVFDAAMAHKVNKGDEFTTIELQDSVKGESTEGADPSKIEFKNDNVEGEVNDQDIVLFWKEADEWHIKSADAVENTIAKVDITTDAEGHDSFTVTFADGSVMLDTRITTPFLGNANKPSQPVFGMMWLGDLENIDVIQWTCAPGVTVGYSLGDNAKAKLQEVIDKVTDDMESIAVSEAGDGSDVAEGEMYVTEDYVTIFTKAIADAQAVVDDESIENDDVELALWYLAQAYGGHTGDMFSKRNNVYFGDDEYNGTGFMTFAKEHTGTMK